MADVVAATTKIQQDRDKRLDELQKATTEWADQETKRLENEALFLKSILKGRTGAGRLTNQNVADASKLVVDEISQFLTG
jgi:hypothetical protein